VPIKDAVLCKAGSTELRGIAQSRSLPTNYLYRARLILMLAEAASFSITVTTCAAPLS
jgi:hypothetical protein